MGDYSFYLLGHESFQILPVLDDTLATMLQTGCIRLESMIIDPLDIQCHQIDAYRRVSSFEHVTPQLEEEKKEQLAMNFGLIYWIIFMNRTAFSMCSSTV